jgi:HPt (histidine-containing phosphotransfer) domain-containing protein
MGDFDSPAMRQVWLNYRDSFAEKRQQLAEVMELASPYKNVYRDDLRKVAHKLAGSSGSYGFLAISNVAIELDELMIANRDNDISEPDWLRVVALTQRLDSCLHQAQSQESPEG